MKIILIAFFILGKSESFACECLPVLTLEDHYKQADIIFLAKIVEIKDSQVEGVKSTLYYRVDSLYFLEGGYSPIFEITKKIQRRI